MFSCIRKSIHDWCGHRDSFWWSHCIHHRYGHLDRSLRSIPSEDIPSQLTKSTVHCLPHISLDFHLSNDISRVHSYLVFISLLDDVITWLFYTAYHEESSDDPDDECNSENDEKCIHRFIVSVCEIIAKTNSRKIPKWMGIFV